jgi:hypothetical protein
MIHFLITFWLGCRLRKDNNEQLAAGVREIPFQLRAAGIAEPLGRARGVQSGEVSFRSLGATLFASPLTAIAP